MWGTVMSGKLRVPKLCPWAGVPVTLIRANKNVYDILHKVIG